MDNKSKPHQLNSKPSVCLDFLNFYLDKLSLHVFSSLKLSVAFILSMIQSPAICVEIHIIHSKIHFIAHPYSHCNACPRTHCFIRQYILYIYCNKQHMDTGRKTKGIFSLTYMSPAKITYNSLANWDGLGGVGLPCILGGVGESAMCGWREYDGMLFCPLFHYVQIAAQPATTFSYTSSNTLNKIRDIQRVLEGFIIQIHRHTHVDTNR